MGADRIGFDHPAWLAAASTGVGYLLVLAVLTLTLFVVPWLVFVAL